MTSHPSSTTGALAESMTASAPAFLADGSRIPGSFVEPSAVSAMRLYTALGRMVEGVIKATYEQFRCSCVDGCSRCNGTGVIER